MQSISTLISDSFLRLDSVSLDDMSDVSLLKRTDTKYIFNKSLIPQILDDVRTDYSILEIKERRLMNYRTLYFDTPDMKFYYDHHRGRMVRTKIRIRKYVDSNLHFFEIKMKNYKGTVKSRLPISDFEYPLPILYSEFAKNITNRSYELEPTLWNKFQRMTLVNFKDKERVTIDLNISFAMKGKEKHAENLAIIELKQERFNRSSRIARALERHNIHSSGFSKYCIGMTQVDSSLKANAFKPKLLSLSKISA